jgi:hypothetical protein
VRTRTQTLRVLPDRLAVARLGPNDETPGWAAGSLVSVTRSPRELSVVCDAASVPDGVPAERDWRGLRVEGPLEFSELGVIASLAVPLAQAEISIFVLSTYDTDYLLVREPELGPAAAALRAAGHTVVEEPKPE